MCMQNNATIELRNLAIPGLSPLLRQMLSHNEEGSSKTKTINMYNLHNIHMYKSMYIYT